MKTILYMAFLIILASFNFQSQPFEAKINKYILKQNRYLTYKPKSNYENHEMNFGLGKIDTNNAIYCRKLILYRKNNLPDNRKPSNYISYTFLKFKDSTQCKETLSKWVNCFGVDCNKIKLNENVIGLKTTPMFIIINNDEILIAHTQCNFSYESLNPQNKSQIWKTAIFDFKNHFSNSNSIFIDVECGGPLKWTTK